jgi:ParB family chromosome partitioning protein
MANTKRRALGRGLSHLIPTNEPDSPAGENDVVHIDSNAVRPNPFQPRTDFDEEEIRHLSESIKNQGLLQPIVVRKLVDGYEIISGERRFRALTLLGKRHVPCIVKAKVSDREMLELALVENIQREDLNEIEKAVAYDRLLRECDFSHDQLAAHVGKSRSAITNSLRLLKLPDPVQEMVRQGNISMGHARALLSLADSEKQVEQARKISEQQLSVRDIERMIQQSSDSSAKKRSGSASPDAKKIDPNLREVIENLQYRFGTPVMIKSKAGGSGKIEIPYYGDDDLNRILDILGYEAG